MSVFINDSLLPYMDSCGVVFTESSWDEDTCEYYVAGRIDGLSRNISLLAILSDDGTIVSECTCKCTVDEPFFDFVFSDVGKGISDLRYFKAFEIR